MKKIAAVLTLTLFALFLFAEGDALVWEASKAGLPGKAYLAGSLHCCRPSFYPLDSLYDRLVAESDMAYFEIYKPRQSLSVQLLTKYSLYRKNGDLEKTAGRENFKKIFKFFSDRRTPVTEAGLRRLRPWIVSNQIAAIILKDSGLDHSAGFETVFEATLKMPCGSLETLESQLKAMASVDDRTMLASLMEVLNEPSKASKEIREITDAYETGNLDGLEKILRETAVKYPGLYKSLMKDRNVKMAASIMKALEQKKTFFILVGAGHFTGPDNIRQLLEKNSFKVKRLKKTGKRGKISPSLPQ